MAAGKGISSETRFTQAPGSSAKPGHRAGEIACSFAEFRLDSDGTLRRGETVVHLPPKELAALRLLLAYSGQVVSPLQLRNALWGNVFVSAESVPKCLSNLRAHLEPDVLIQTVYKRGYRLSAEVRHHGGTPAAAQLRLAILPFATGYSIPEHLGSAIAEETITRLTNAHNPALAVLARDSVFTLAQRGLSAQEIGQTLSADLVLTGSLRALSSQFRLRAEMIRVEDGTQIWVEDLLVDQNRIAGLETELLRRLGYRLHAGVPDERAWLEEGDKSGISISAEAAAPQEGEVGPQHREAYEIFLRGRHEWQTLHRHRMQDGLQHLLRATELDPTLVSAKVDLVHLCVTQAIYGFMSPAVAAELVHRTAESIHDLAGQAEAILPALGWVNFHFDHDLPAARRALAASAYLPHGSWTTRIRSIFALSRGRFAEAIDLLRAAIQLDPYAPWLQSRLAWALHLDGQASESVAQIQSTLSHYPNHEFTNLYGALILAFNGKAEHGVQLAQELGRRMPFFDLAPAVQAYALACAGRKDDARGILERLEWLSRERYLLKSFTPAVYLALGDTEAAIAELRASNEARCPWFFQMLIDPRLKTLHGHQEFEKMRAILTAMEAEVARELPAEE